MLCASLIKFTVVKTVQQLKSPTESICLSVCLSLSLCLLILLNILSRTLHCKPTLKIEHKHFLAGEVQNCEKPIRNENERSIYPSIQPDLSIHPYNQIYLSIYTTRSIYITQPYIHLSIYVLDYLSNISFSGHTLNCTTLPHSANSGKTSS